MSLFAGLGSTRVADAWAENGWQGASMVHHKSALHEGVLSFSKLTIRLLWRGLGFSRPQP